MYIVFPIGWQTLLIGWPVVLIAGPIFQLVAPATKSVRFCRWVAALEIRSNVLVSESDHGGHRNAFLMNDCVVALKGEFM